MLACQVLNHTGSCSSKENIPFSLKKKKEKKKKKIQAPTTCPRLHSPASHLSTPPFIGPPAPAPSQKGRKPCPLVGPIRERPFRAQIVGLPCRTAQRPHPIGRPVPAVQGGKHHQSTTPFSIVSYFSCGFSRCTKRFGSGHLAVASFFTGPWQQYTSSRS